MLIKIKTRIYAAPAVKGLMSSVYRPTRTPTIGWGIVRGFLWWLFELSVNLITICEHGIPAGPFGHQIWRLVIQRVLHHHLCQQNNTYSHCVSIPLRWKGRSCHFTNDSYVISRRRCSIIISALCAQGQPLPVIGQYKDLFF